MRNLTMNEIHLAAGGDGTTEFNQCMAENWGENTVVGGVGGLFVGGAVGGILGAMGGSTGTFVYCGFVAIF